MRGGKPQNLESTIMEDNMKKLIAMMMALVMILSLVACAAKEEAPVVEDEPIVEADGNVALLIISYKND